MKLELTLPERPGLLHALPVCDLFLMLWLLFMLGSTFSRQAGVAVELPSSQFQLERYRETLVVTLAPGENQPQLHLGRDAVTFEELERQLKRLSDMDAQSNSIILLRTDQATPVGAQRRVKEMALAMDFRVAVLGSDEPQAVVEPETPSEPQPGPQPEPKPEQE